MSKKSVLFLFYQYFLLMTKGFFLKRRKRKRKRKKRKREYLRWELSAESFADENGVSVHELPKAILNTLYQYCFHHFYSTIFFFLFLLLLLQESAKNKHENKNTPNLTYKSDVRFWFLPNINGKKQRLSLSLCVLCVCVFCVCVWVRVWRRCSKFEILGKSNEGKFLGLNHKILFGAWIFVWALLFIYV